MFFSDQVQQIQQIQSNLIQSISDGLIVMDFEGTVRYANPIAAQILGVDVSELIGAKFVKMFLLQPENDPFVQAVLDMIYENSAFWSGIVTFYLRGEVRHLRMTSSLFWDSYGKAAGITIVLSDLSELMELKDSLKAMEKINELNKQLNARNELLSKTFGQFLSDEIVKAKI